MKKILGLFVLLIQLDASSQLTNSEVYDFEVGDVHYSVIYNSGPGALYILDTIASKTWSQNLDTIWYGIKRMQHSPDITGQTNGSYLFTMETKMVTHLNVPAHHFIDNICDPDTTGFTKLTLDSTELCGTEMDFLTTYFDPSVPLPCLEPLQWTSKLYAGLGGPYYSRTDNSAVGLPGYYYNKYLSYFNTQMHGTCGSFPSFAEVPELGKIDFLVYPNPVQSTFSISTNVQNYNYRIISSTGQILVNHMFPANGPIDVSSLERGVYILELFSPSVSSRRQFVKV